jgi:alpha-1,3-rhamnosyltransferase
MSDNNSDSLVSIIVVTYNSAKFVLETLESAKSQTYPNIELIVSDDCSSDNTVEICQNWFNANQERFVRYELIESNINTGVSPNCNRGCSVSKGVWLKLIAGDDILVDNCIELFIKQAQQSETEIFYSNFFLFKSVKEKNQKVDLSSFFKGNLKENFLKHDNFFPAITMFIKHKKLKEINYFDENFPNIEDLPLIITFFETNSNITFLTEYTVMYRIHNESASNKYHKNTKYFKDLKKVCFTKLIPFYINNRNFINVIDKYIYLFYQQCAITLGNNKFSFIFLRPLMILSPKYILKIFEKIKHCLTRRLSNTARFLIRY